MSDTTVNIAERAKRLRSPKFGEIAQVRGLIADMEDGTKGVRIATRFFVKNSHRA